MTPRKPIRASNKVLSRAKSPSRAKSLPSTWRSGSVLRTTAVVLGAVGLAALAVTALSSRRLRDEYVRPLSEAALVPLAAMAPQADRVWAETRPWRDHVASLLSSINTEEVRAALAERLSQWVERLR